METDAERRKCDRCLAHDQTYAMLKSANTLGMVQNLSEAGLQLKYIDERGCLRGGLKDRCEEVEIFNSGLDFHLKNVPCRIVHDCRVCRNRIYITTMPVRLCGIAFKRIKKEEKESICAFIDFCRYGTDMPSWPTPNP